MTESIKAGVLFVVFCVVFITFDQTRRLIPALLLPCPVLPLRLQLESSALPKGGPLSVPQPVLRTLVHGPSPRPEGPPPHDGTAFLDGWSISLALGQHDLGGCPEAEVALGAAAWGTSAT